jgi:hypothetical protein
MSIQTPKFGYITSTKVDNRAAGEIFKNDVRPGQQSVVSPAVNASGSTLGRNSVGDEMVKVEVKSGTTKQRVNVDFAVKDLVLAPASGMTVTGQLTYGSGKITNTLTYASDAEQTGRGDFEIFRPQKPTVYKYNALST